MNAKARPLVQALHVRNVTLRQLCESVPISYEHFSAVLNQRRPGRHTWPKLRNLLTEDERAAVVEQYGKVFHAAD